MRKHRFTAYDRFLSRLMLLRSHHVSLHIAMTRHRKFHFLTWRASSERTIRYNLYTHIAKSFYSSLQTAKAFRRFREYGRTNGDARILYAHSVGHASHRKCKHTTNSDVMSNAIAMNTARSSNLIKRTVSNIALLARHISYHEFHRKKRSVFKWCHTFMANISTTRIQCRLGNAFYTYWRYHKWQLYTIRKKKLERILYRGALHHGNGIKANYLRVWRNYADKRNQQRRITRYIQCSKALRKLKNYRLKVVHDRVLLIRAALRYQLRRIVTAVDTLKLKGTSHYDSMSDRYIREIENNKGEKAMDGDQSSVCHMSDNISMDANGMSEEKERHQKRAEGGLGYVIGITSSCNNDKHKNETMDDLNQNYIFDESLSNVVHNACDTFHSNDSLQPHGTVEGGGTRLDKSDDFSGMDLIQQSTIHLDSEFGVDLTLDRDDMIHFAGSNEGHIVSSLVRKVEVEDIESCKQTTLKEDVKNATVTHRQQYQQYEQYRDTESDINRNMDDVDHKVELWNISRTSPTSQEGQGERRVVNTWTQAQQHVPNIGHEGIASRVIPQLHHRKGSPHTLGITSRCGTVGCNDVEGLENAASQRVQRVQLCNKDVDHLYRYLSWGRYIVESPIDIRRRERKTYLAFYDCKQK